MPDATDNSVSIWTRVRQNKVVQWTLAYAAVAYTLLHGVQMLSASMGWSERVENIATLVAAMGVPVTALLAWFRARSGFRMVGVLELVIVTVLVNSVLWSLARTSYLQRASQTPSAAGAASATAPAPRTAIAVLPFANLTGDPGKEYLGEGMAEELINTLAQVPGLRVPARTSSFAYKGPNTNIRQVATDLGVGTVLDGSVQSAGERIRITAQLIDTRDNSHLWTQTYDRKFTDLFQLQDEVARAVVQALAAKLTGASLASVAPAPPTGNVEAYNLYLQGTSLVSRVSEQNVLRALGYFEQAVALDPKFARAYAGIADAHMPLAGTLGLQPFQHLAAAEQAAQKALALDPQLANPHLALASIAGLRGALLERETQDRAALSLGGNDGFVLIIRAAHQGEVGHLREMLEMAKRAYALAPALPPVVAFLANSYSIVGRDDEAHKYARIAVDLGYPADSNPLAVVTARAAHRDRDYGRATEVVAKTYDASDPDQARTIEVLKLVFGALADPGKRGAALAARDNLYPRLPGGKLRGAPLVNAVPCLRSSIYFALLDAPDVAYGLANACLDHLAPGGIRSIGVITNVWAAEFRRFRQDSRFQALANRLGWMEYWQQYGPPDECDLKDGKLSCH